jgi:hypothetical protein
MRSIEEFVPAHYQASAFPAFAALVAALAFDVVERSERASWAARLGLLATTSSVAIARLVGAVPLSGHAVLFAAVLAYALLPPRAPGARIAAVAAAPGLVITGYYKLFVWDDPAWFAASLATGAAIGFACSRAAGRHRSP